LGFYDRRAAAAKRVDHSWWLTSSRREDGSPSFIEDLSVFECIERCQRLDKPKKALPLVRSCIVGEIVTRIVQYRGEQ
jgi:hypothetical protein